MGWAEVAVLVVIALLVFGPEKLPKVAAQAGRQLRQIRRMATSARDDLRAGLGPEFADFDPADLNPKRFVRKHLLEDDDLRDLRDMPDLYDPPPAVTAGGGHEELAYGEVPPYDPEAT
ncbi:sec-independent translocase [Bailinhaonella thermotolerans]